VGIGLSIAAVLLGWSPLEWVFSYLFSTPPSFFGPSAFGKAADFAYAMVRSDFQKRVKARRRRRTWDLEAWSRDRRIVLGGLDREDRATIAQVYAKANSVFEFGLGESTFLADHLEVPRYAGIDSNINRINMCRQNVTASFRFYYADIGQTSSSTGRAAGGEKLPPKTVYDSEIAPLMSEPLPFDVYRVDGRWGFPLLLLSFLHASDRGAAPSDTTVLLHGCWKEGHSHPGDKSKQRGVDSEAADHLLDLVRHSGFMLCVYKRKPTTTDEELLELWKEHHDKNS